MKKLNTTNPIAFLMAAVTISMAIPVLPAAQSGSNSPVQDMPKNLKVLPKDLTTRQVREIMESWSDEIGADCGTCHVRDSVTPTRNGRAQYDYASDSKEEKRSARVMYEMTEEVNSKFVSQVPNSGMPVTCGYCHRGHLSPEPYDSESNSAPVNQHTPSSK